MENPHKVDISSENVKNNERMNLTVANRVPIWIIYWIQLSQKPRDYKGDGEGIPHIHPIPQVIRLELFLESG